MKYLLAFTLLGIFTLGVLAFTIPTHPSPTPTPKPEPTTTPHEKINIDTSSVC